MKKVDWRQLQIEPHHIIVAYTTDPDYEMGRQILIDADDHYVVLEGSHCSCFGFDEVEWDAIEYTYDELAKLARADYNREEPFWMAVKRLFY